MSDLDEVWERLRSVSVVQFQSESRTGIGWAGKGVGVVKVSEPESGILLFDETGRWRQEGGAELRFTNVFRWKRQDEKLSLEHLRFGPQNPVFLFEMALAADGAWRETSPHLCKLDCYTATLRVKNEELQLDWTVHGPTRDEFMAYRYF